VVAVGLTPVEPLGPVVVNVPGVMAMLVAPVVSQLSSVLEPELMVAGVAVKEIIEGGVAAVTATVTVVVFEPEALLAFSV